MNSAAGTETYREFLYPSVNTFMSIAIVFPTIWLTLYPWNRELGLLFGAFASLALSCLALLRAPSISVTDTHFRVGKVSIPRAEIGAIEVLKDEASRHARGPGLDPKAYVLFRGTTRNLVRVHLVSAIDPTPYWLVSSRKPEQLAAALGA